MKTKIFSPLKDEILLFRRGVQNMVCVLQVSCKNAVDLDQYFLYRLEIALLCCKRKSGKIGSSL